MKSLLRNTFLSTFGNIKSIGYGVHILNSHYISRKDLPKEIFHDLLLKIAKQADFIKFEDAVELISSKKVRNVKAIAFSFDDGFEECFTKIAPVLKDFNTNAAFFLNPGFIDGNEEYVNNFNQNVVHVNKNPMTWKMVKELHEDGFIIGNHTLDHVKLVGLSKEENNDQIIKSKTNIEKHTGSKCDYFAWTYGRIDDISKEALIVALREHQFVFSGDNYTKYHSLNNPSIINRRHIEGNWPVNHVKYFLSKGKTY